MGGLSNYRHHMACVCVFANKLQAGPAGEWVTHEVCKGPGIWERCWMDRWAMPGTWKIHRCVCACEPRVLCACMHQPTSLTSRKEEGVSAACVCVLHEPSVCMCCWREPLSGAAFVDGHVNVLPVCVHVSLGYLLSFPTGWTWKRESGNHVPWPGQGAPIPKHWSGPQQPAGVVLGWSCWRGSYTLLCLPHLTNSISLSLHLKSPKGCKFSLILLPSVRLRFNRKKVEKILSSWSLVFNLIERTMFPEWDTVGEMSS